MLIFVSILVILLGLSDGVASLLRSLPPMVAPEMVVLFAVITVG